MKMQNVECRMQNEEGIPEILRNRCHIRSGIQQGSGAKRTFKCGARSAECEVRNGKRRLRGRVYDNFDSYQSYDTNSERGSGISVISGEKSHPSLPQKSRRIRASQDLQCDLFRRLELDACAGPKPKVQGRSNEDPSSRCCDATGAGAPTFGYVRICSLDSEKIIYEVPPPRHLSRADLSFFRG